MEHPDNPETSVRKLCVPPLLVLCYCTVCVCVCALQVHKDHPKMAKTAEVRAFDGLQDYKFTFFSCSEREVQSCGASDVGFVNLPLPEPRIYLSQCFQ